VILPSHALLQFDFSKSDLAKILGNSLGQLLFGPISSIVWVVPSDMRCSGTWDFRAYGCLRILHYCFAEKTAKSPLWGRGSTLK
jgi:hypothetical protein